MPLWMKYLVWIALALVCVLAFNVDAFTRTRALGMSIPIEVVAVLLCGILLIAAYAIGLSNRYFRWLVWAVLLGSTSPVALLLMLSFLGWPGGLIATLVLYLLTLFALSWCLLCRRDQNPEAFKYRRE